MASSFVYYSAPKGTPVLVLPPGRTAWVYHESTKRVSFSDLQILPKEKYHIDDSFTVVNLNHWITAVPNESIEKTII